MNRLLVFAAVAAALLLALRHPAPVPPTVASTMPVPAPHMRRAHLPVASGGMVVYVVGAVAHPGLYEVAADARVNDAVRRAGGLRSDADPTAVNLAQHVSDGDEIFVPRIGEAPVATAHKPRRKSTRRRAPIAAASIDLNTADAAALATIPGIGQTLAARIVAFRELNGPFASLDELADVAGITQRRIDAMEPYVTL